MFPPEIFERILFQCDGRTLMNAKEVNTTFRDIVEYLTNETFIWKACCVSEIPDSELLQYRTKWITSSHENPKNKWLHLYENWINWFNIRKNIDFEIIITGHTQRINCINAIGKYIALGFENGSVRVYDPNFQFIKTYRHINMPVQSVFLIYDDTCEEPSEILICYGGRVYINDFCNSEFYTPGLFPNCYKFSSYKRFMCGVTVCGRITIAKITSDDINRKKSYSLITYVRIYSPETVTCCKLWNGVCTVLVNNSVKIINYNENILRNNVMAREKTRLEFSNATHYETPRDIKIFNNKIIISLSKCFNSLNRQIFELYILGENNQNSKKMFIPWQIFTANITAMFLYGNTFLIGLSSGFVYFYEIQDWKSFNIRSYRHKENICKQSPIIAMDAIESHGRRIFFIATDMKIFKVVGYSVPYIEDSTPLPILW